MSDSFANIRHEGEKAIVDVSASHVDFRNAEQFKAILKDLYTAGSQQVLLNLSQFTFMDSSGLSVLLVGKRSADEAGGSFSIFGIQGYVNNLVELTHLNRAIPIYQSEEEAMSC